MQNLYEETHPGYIKLKYEGEVSFELIDSILFTLSKRLELVEKNVNLRKKVYTILMECAQNLCFHTDSRDNGAKTYKRASISLDNANGYYLICTRNYIKKNKIAGFEQLLRSINNKSAEELKNMYNQVLTNNYYSPKGGGGLGLIDIARKSRESLEYQFIEVDGDYALFTLKISVKS